MYDQSFCRKTLERCLWKRDFGNVPTASHQAFRESILANAIASAETCFNAPTKPLMSFRLRGKLIYRLVNLHDELVVRKLTRNVKWFMPRAGEGRSQIVTNLHLLLAEGVPYRIYRLDVRNFYESFEKREVLKALHEYQKLSPQSIALIETLLNSHTQMKGLGIPRGLSLSAVLSDLLMQQFDHLMRSAVETFYYSRYVDDIIIVTSARENTAEFVAWIRNSLPPGLKLNPEKKKIVETLKKVDKIKGPSTGPTFSFDYLGYAFAVSNPTTKEAGGKNKSELNRCVSINIASRKLQKIKTRIVRSFLDFSSSGDWGLLRDRIAFLTQNFSVYNPKAGGKKLAGIYHSYPLVTTDSGGLLELDRFLRNAVFARTGRVFSKSALLLSSKQKRQLLGSSFVRGHTTQSFIHFSANRISEIQRCWAN
ncbi:MAG: antiviral reverse transcriptase Drt3a [Candidatus Accumulibacter sp. UW26]